MNNCNDNQHFSRMKVVALSALILLGAAAFTACDPKNDPTPPTPPIPPVKVDTVRYENQTNLDKVPDALTAAKTVNRYADFSLAPGTRIDFRAGDWNKLTQLLELLGIEASKVRVNLNGSALNPRETINLTDPQCDLLSALWNQGLTFIVGTDGAFYITTTQESKLTAEMREHVFYADARPVAISNANELESKCQEAAQLASTGQKVMVTLTGTWNLNAGQLVPFRLLNHANIVTMNNANITVTMDKHPTRSYELNSVYGMMGNRINLKTVKNASAFKGENTILANDTTLWLLRTAATADKDQYPGAKYVYNFVGDDNKLANPMIGLWTFYNGQRRDDYYDKIVQTVDGQLPEWMTFGSIDMDTYNGGDGGWLILAEALAKVHYGMTSDHWADYFNPFMDSATVNITQDSKYIGKGYLTPNGRLDGININYGDLGFFNPLPSIDKSRPNFNLLFSTSSSIVFNSNGKNIAIVLSNAAAWDIKQGTGSVTEYGALNRLKETSRITFTGGGQSCLVVMFDGVYQLDGEVFPLDIRQTMTYNGR